MLAHVNGVTRSTDFAPCEVLCGFVLGPSGLVEGVYGSEKLIEEAGVCEREGAALNVAGVVRARLYRGRVGRAHVSVGAVPDWNWRRYREASESCLCLSLSSLEVLSSEDMSEKATEERLECSAVGERGATMSRK